ncbi:radical SAM protein [Myxococcota bacterium]|nr:radical SAM protein [Myxococcota bacterium]MBU1380877.1 radical SAM protein [Myxococcota bacterium]MBU1498617.1 radical SAM protein [Myxococcota bacterium]
MNLKSKILLILPPFTQLNTPYPSTAFLTGFLKKEGMDVKQRDLGIEVISELFSSAGLSGLFEEIDHRFPVLPPPIRDTCNSRDAYIDTIDEVMAFLRGNNPAIAHRICNGTFLPEGRRFETQSDTEWAFGTTGTTDKARYFATLYLEDIGDLIISTIEPDFGFSRYAEQIGRCARTFDKIQEQLDSEDTYIDRLMLVRLTHHLETCKPDIVGLSVPFPGNLLCALKCGKYIKAHFPHIKVIMGGGFPSTELRSLRDPRVFSCTDFITLDDGFRPIVCVIEHIEGHRLKENLKRTLALTDEDKESTEVVFYDGAPEPDVAIKNWGAPDYSELPLDRYISTIEVTNPMHRLWNDGRWNKLMIAHGCYWGKCSFCDTTLDYISRFEPASASDLCDRIEAVMKQTQYSGFHFVDEAAPPAVLRNLSKELLRRKLQITWWTNIRFESAFDEETCALMAQAGCIAVSGGLEVASERLLKLINKGVSLEQVAKVTSNLTGAGIMVHAYLMYGFPTQTAQETIDSLEIVRQMFDNGLIQSGFWHHFALTVHSDVFANPDDYGVILNDISPGSFANNDAFFTDPSGVNHEKFGPGLRKSLYNYMHGIGLEFPSQTWFSFKTPVTKIPSNYIENFLEN